jgi:hypothetical protein
LMPTGPVLARWNSGPTSLAINLPLFKETLLCHGQEKFFALT